MADLSSPQRHSAISAHGGSGLAGHLALVVVIKILALTLLWAVFFRAAP